MKRELEETSARYLRELDEFKKLIEQFRVSSEIYQKADEETRIKLEEDFTQQSQLQSNLSKAGKAVLKTTKDKTELHERYRAYVYVAQQKLLSETLRPRPSLTQGVLQGYNYA